MVKLSNLDNLVMYFGLFNDDITNSNYSLSNERWKVNNELERMWKEAEAEENIVTCPGFRDW
jgi:hypothetical protein